jgi:hypothetical protein
MTVVSLWLTATGLPALTAGPATWMRAVASAAGVLRAVMPTSSTATEAATEIATIFKWVARSASTIVELLITAIFRGLFQTWGATYVVSWADIWVQMHPNARSLFLDCGVSVLRPGMTASSIGPGEVVDGGNVVVIVTRLHQPVLNVPRRNANTKARRFGVSRTTPG